MALPAADVEGVSFEGDAHIAFHKQYNFRGVKVGDRAPSLGADFIFPVSTNSELALKTGGWYINPAKDDNDELGLYAFLVVPVADLNFSLGGIFFDFAESDELTGEFGVAATYSVANYLDLELAWWSDVKGDGAPGDELQLRH